MNSIPKIAPKYLSLITTYKCTSACPNCCFNCSPRPKITATMTYDDMKNYMLQATNSFPSLGLVVFTGGECTLLYNDLIKSIKYAVGLGLKTRIVTNGHWAIKDDEMDKVIDDLIESGLTEINFSTGDEHAKFIPVTVIAKVTAACAKRKEFSSIAINIECSPNGNIDKKTFWADPNIEQLSVEEKKKIICLQSTWIEFRVKKAHNTSNQSHTFCLTNKQGCTSILDTININPNGQFLSCCGLSCEYSPFLKLGKIKENLKYLHNKRFDDIMKLWLYTEGPYAILKSISGSIPDDNKHICEYCHNLLTSRDNINRLLSISEEQIKHIMFNYTLKAKRYEKEIY